MGREGQFEHISDTVAQAIRGRGAGDQRRRREPRAGRRFQGRRPGVSAEGSPVEVRRHDFKDTQLGHEIPYGVYDLAAAEGWASVGITSDTVQFAVNTIIGSWEHLGKARYPHAQTLTNTADPGRSNNPRTRLWRHELQRLAKTAGLSSVRVFQFPPGTSKWNQIEHRMFSFVSLN